MSTHAGDEYTCAACRGVFLATRFDDEAMADATAAFGTKAEDCAVVCDDCWHAMRVAIPEMDRELREAGIDE